jgi:uncharacterized protein (TIGR02145 family)
MGNIKNWGLGLLILFVQDIYGQNRQSIVDQRDGKSYLVAEIGNQIWMAQNLDFEIQGSWCYENKPENCQKFGRLYTYTAAMVACPAGWHLPTDEDWIQLEKHLGMPDSDLLKENAWRGTNQAEKLVSDSTLAFFLLYGGYRNPPSNYNILNHHAFFWTSSTKHGSAYFRQMYDGSKQIFRRTRPHNWAFSVRCVKD